jgi:hypothetical protein
MIRNPSDGTTYDPPKPSKEISLQANEIKANCAKTGSKEITSGMPELETEMGNPKSKDEIRRLEESRDWLKNYNEGNEC